MPEKIIVGETEVRFFSLFSDFAILEYLIQIFGFCL